MPSAPPACPPTPEAPRCPLGQWSKEHYRQRPSADDAPNAYDGGIVGADVAAPAHSPPATRHSGAIQDDRLSLAIGPPREGSSFTADGELYVRTDLEENKLLTVDQPPAGDGRR